MERKESRGAVTKQKLADAFTSLMATKSFDEITITEITQKIGVTRLTFYYHFEDKYQLLNYIVQKEVIEPFSDGLSYDNWPKKLEEALATIKGNQRFFRNAIDYDKEEFTRFLLKVTGEIIGHVLRDIMEGGIEIKKKDRQFLEEFFAYGIAGTIESWINRGMPDSPASISRRIKAIIDDAKIVAFRRYLQTTKEG